MEQKEERKIDFKRNLREYWAVAKKRKWLFFTMIFLILFIEILTLVDKFLFKLIIDHGTEFAAGDISHEVLIRTFLLVAGVFVFAIISKSFFRWLISHFLIKFDLGSVKDLKSKYFNHIIDLSHNFHTTHKTGSLISRLNRGSSALERMSDTIIFQLAPIIIQLVAISISFAVFDLGSTISLIVMVIFFVSFSFLINNKQKESQLEMTKAEDYEKGFISNIFMNIETIKYFGKERFINRRFDEVTNKTITKATKYFNYYRWFDSIQYIIIGAGTFFVIYFPLMKFLTGELTIGTLAFIYSAYLGVLGPLFGFVWGLRGYYRAMGDFQDLFEYGEIQNDIKDKPNAKKAQINKGSIEFKDVSFSYGRKKAFSLDKFNLKIKPNEKVALVGHLGCGKTTLIKLIYRLYDTKEGKILIDNQDLTDLKQESLRSEMSIVPQEAILFDDTLYNNIKFSNPKATKSEVWKAIKFARLENFVNNLPEKENTIVGERGIKLSGGERQRVSIARAILANKKILILDEATSALDSETEHEIQQDLAKLLQGRTSIIIAHRLSTIMSADRIIVMKGGKIIEQGSHNSLIRKNGEYKKLWRLQKGGYLKQ